MDLMADLEWIKHKIAAETNIAAAVQRMIFEIANLFHSTATAPEPSAAAAESTAAVHPVTSLLTAVIDALPALSVAVLANTSAERGTDDPTPVPVIPPAPAPSDEPETKAAPINPGEEAP